MRAAFGVMVAHFTATPQALGGLGGVDGHLVVGGVAMLQAQVVVLGLQIDMRKQQLVLDHLPDDARHLVAVHLHERRGHRYFRHSQPFRVQRAVSPPFSRTRT